MPFDGIGEVIGTAVEAIGEAALTDPPRRDRGRRVGYWLLAAVMVGLLVAGAYFATG